MRKFRILTVFLFLIAFKFAFGQLFYFNDNETTLTKTTDQSPAHWYLEIYSNSPVDTVLEWEAEFVNIPTEWGINLDCQSTWFPTVNHQDVGEFVLWSNPDFPQKMIIGAMLNDTPGTGSTYFTIRDPHNPGYTEQIAFHFVISQGTASLPISELGKPFSISNQVIFVDNDVSVEGIISDVTGKTLLEIDATRKEIDLKPFRNELLIITLKTDINQHFFLKILPQ